MKILIGVLLLIGAIAAALPSDTKESWPTLALALFIVSVWLLGTARHKDEDAYWKIMAWPLAISVFVGIYEIGELVVKWVAE